MKRWSRGFRWTLISLLLLGGMGASFWPRVSVKPQPLSKNRLYRLMERGQLVSAQVSPTDYDGIFAVEGEFRRKAAAEPVRFAVTTQLSADQLAELLARPRVHLELPKTRTRGPLLDMIPALIVIGIILGLLLYQLHLGRGRAMHRSRSRPTVTFGEIAGIDEAKAEVQEVVDFLRSPARYHKLGGRLPKGILLVGPPGTGKTMLARAIASEAEAAFFSASGSDFTEVFVGVGAKRIRHLFRQARKQSPAIIFIDEIDCLGKSRKFDQNGEFQQTINALLTAMDGFDASEGLVVIGATNRPEDLDEALLRPGRFDRKVYVPLPDSKGRRAILETHTRQTPLSADRTLLDRIARTTSGMSGAELANLINEAALLSANRNKSEIGLAEMEEARDKVRWGKERRSLVVRAEERRVVAYHEAGHALVHLQHPGLPPLHKVSIIPRGHSLGSTTTLPEEDQNLHSKRFFLQHLSVLMGGRAAEQLFFGDVTNGANGDLDSAKNVARKMIHDWGMGERLYYQPDKADAEREINELLSTAYDQALGTVRRFRVETERLAESLLVEETLDREQVLRLIEGAVALSSVPVPIESGIDPAVSGLESTAACRSATAG